MHRTQIKIEPGAPRPGYVQITEQPLSGSIRFRYECESRFAGSIPGANSTKENPTYPTIELTNCTGPGTVIVSLVTDDNPARPHPHSLVGKDCKDGICVRQLSHGERRISFSGIGIQCKKRQDIRKAIEERLIQKVDPFKTHTQQRPIQASDYDLAKVRLCFQVYLPSPDSSPAPGRRSYQALPAVVTEVIVNKRATAELKIVDFAPGATSCRGGEKIIILCEKMKQNDVEVIFHDASCGWEAVGQATKTGVFRSVAFVLTVPPYRDTLLSDPVEIEMYIRMKSDSEKISEPVKFKYTPHYGGEEQLNQGRSRKRPRRDDPYPAEQDYPSYGQSTLMDAAANAAGVPTNVDDFGGGDFNGLHDSLKQAFPDPSQGFWNPGDLPTLQEPGLSTVDQAAINDLAALLEATEDTIPPIVYISSSADNMPSGAFLGNMFGGVDEEMVYNSDQLLEAAANIQNIYISEDNP